MYFKISKNSSSLTSPWWFGSSSSLRFSTKHFNQTELTFKLCPAAHCFSTYVEIFSCHHSIIFKEIVHLLVDVLCLEFADVGIFVYNQLTIARIRLIIPSGVQVRLLGAWHVLLPISFLLLVFLLFLDRFYSQRIDLHLLGFLFVLFRHFFCDLRLSHPLYFFCSLFFIFYSLSFFRFLFSQFFLF